MTYLMWFTYLGVLVGLLIIPGNMTMLAMTHGVRYGVKKSIGTALGSMTAGLCTMTISMAGLAAIVTSSETVYNCIKWGGAAYLVYLGIDCMRSPGVNLSSVDKTVHSKLDRPAKKLFLQAFLAGMANPKGIIFFAAFFPQFINVDSPKLPQFLILAVTFMICDFLNMMFYASASRLIVPFLNNQRRGKIFNIVTGSIFIGAGTLVAAYNG